jgi:hypothetical protein
MRQKLFTKQIDDMLFKQYAMGNDLSKQKVVAKIFNPYGRGVWYLLNSDPSDPDYIWAIVDLFEVEVGSVSRKSLEMMKVPPFGLNLERDMYFQPINAEELFQRVLQGERFAKGGNTNLSRDRKFKSQQSWEQDYQRKKKPSNPHYNKFEDGGGIDLLADTSGETLQNVGGTAFSNVDLTSHLDLTNPMFKKGGVMFNNGDFRDILGEAVTHLYKAENNLELAIRYLEKTGQGGTVSSFKKKYKFIELKSIIRELDEASEKKRFNDGGNVNESTRFMSSDKMEYDNGGSIPNNYLGRKADDIWDNLSEDQRTHFLIDHFEEMNLNNNSMLVASKQEYKDLSQDVKNAFLEHAMMGQYADGGTLGAGSYADGGMMAKGGAIRSQKEFNNLVEEKRGVVKNLSPKEVAEMWNRNTIGSPNRMTEEEAKMSNAKIYLADLLVEKELTEAEYNQYFAKGGMMADGGTLGAGSYAKGGMMANGGGVDNYVFIALSKTKNGRLISERFDKQITHKELFDFYKKRGYEIIDSNIFKVTNKGVLDIFKDAISKFIKEKYNELVDWENSFLSYEIIGDRIIVQSSFVKTKNGNEYKITPNDLVNKKFNDGGGVDNDASISQLKKIKSDGKLIRYLDVRGSGKKLFDIIVADKSEKGNYKRYESTSKGTLGTLQNAYLNEEDVLQWLRQTSPKKMASGGVTFDKKVSSISKSLLKRKKVSPSVQKDYGKTYNKSEAKDSAKRIVGSMTKMERAKKIASAMPKKKN